MHRMREQIHRGRTSVPVLVMARREQSQTRHPKVPPELTNAMEKRLGTAVQGGGSPLY